jgi:8-oxo-(d)GTP phosphatase
MIRAAGGVVVRVRPGVIGPPATADLEVLVVHRAGYDDWSLPKGHLDGDEDEATAAVREVLEETGVQAHITAPLGTSEHDTSAGRKQVRWFLMRAIDGDPAMRPVDREVDVARFVPEAELATLLTYPADLRVVRDALDRSRPDDGAPPSVTDGGAT